jgi:hypothetical protein
MSKFQWSALILYLTTAASYGGWRGRDLWSDWVVWCLLLPPFVWGLGKTIIEWRHNPYWVFIKIGLVMTAVAVVTIGGQALLLAWLVAEGTERCSASPTVRAVTGAGMMAAVTVMMWVGKRYGKPAELQDTNVPEDTEGSAGPSIAPDHGT